VKFTITVKNKWARGWTRAWFYYKVPLLQSPSPGRGEGVFAFLLDMYALDFATDPSFECADNDAGDVAFLSATHSIGSRDAVE
jgi:hypothetical protein